jgi:hypothetical protein
MTVNDTTLNLLNQANLENPGKIGQAVILDGNTYVALFSLGDFDPSTMDVVLPLGQISNLNELELVRKEIEWFESLKDPYLYTGRRIDQVPLISRYIQLNQWYRDWFDSTSEPEEILND